MNLLDRLKLLVQSTVNEAVHDLVGDDQRRSDTRKGSTTDRSVNSASTANTEKLLRQADQRIEKLRDDLAGTVAQEKRAEPAWREAGAKAAQLNSEVDALLRNNQGDDARARLQQAQSAARQAADLEQELQRLATLSVQLRQEIEGLEGQLGQIRRRMQQAGGREGQANSAVQTQQPRPAQQQDTAPVEQTVQALEEQVAPHEDTSDAKANVDGGLDSSRMADVLKKLQEQRNQQNAGTKD